MNGTLCTLLLTILLLTDLWFAASSRLLHCIRLAAWQGILIGLLPLAFHDGADLPGTGVLAIVILSVGIKGFLLPVLLKKAMLRAKVKRELEPLIGYALSLGIVLAGALLAFFFCFKCGLFPDKGKIFSSSVALTAMFTGLFIITARRKAITQAIGFLIFENGITIFGIGMGIENGFAVELGILLDVFVLVFVMGIAVFRISRSFAHVDADKLHELNDSPEEPFQ